MVNSRDISLLRRDVYENVKVFLRLCKEQGLEVCITQTVRDDEYQEYLYSLGRTRSGSKVTNSRRTTFHGCGLAFDICQNIKGQEYSDSAFFKNCATIAKHLGFSWGGDWENFTDKPHFQWDERGKYKFNRQEGPAPMPLYEEEDMTQEKFNQMLETYFESLRKKEPSGYSEDARAWAEELGIIQGNAAGEKQYKMFCTREQMITFLKRLEDSRK